MAGDVLNWVLYEPWALGVCLSLTYFVNHSFADRQTLAACVFADVAQRYVTRAEAEKVGEAENANKAQGQPPLPLFTRTDNGGVILPYTPFLRL